MRSLVQAAVLAAGLLGIGSGADAETRLLQVPTRYLVVPPMQAGSKRVATREVAFEFPLRWERAAVLSHDIEITADSKRQVLRQGQALAETRLQFDDPSFANAKSFCVPRVADPLSKAPSLFNSVLGRAIARAMNNGQFCLIDRDGRGAAQFSVYIGGGSAAARQPHPISPALYTLTPAAVVTEGDCVRLRYGGGSAVSVEIVEQGQNRKFQTLEYRDGSGRHRFNNTLWGVKTGEGTFMVDAPGMSFRVSQYDRSTNSGLFEWSSTSAPVIVPIPDTIRYTVY